MPTLKEFMAENHSARVEYEADITEAKKTGKEEGVKAFQEKMEKVLPVLGSTYYPKPIKELAIKAIKGESSPDAVDAAVASFDSTAEGQNLKAAAEEQKGQKETPAQHQQSQSTEDGSIENEESFEAEMARMGFPSEKKEA